MNPVKAKKLAFKLILTVAATKRANVKTTGLMTMNLRQLNVKFIFVIYRKS